MNETAVRWVRGLPMRWGFGGSVLGIVWSLASVVVQGSFSNPLGGKAVALARVFALIGTTTLRSRLCVGGWSEKFTLERYSAEGSGRLEKAIRRSALRLTGKAMVCGVFFGLFTYGLGLFCSFRPWDSEANTMGNIFGVFGFALLAVPVGIIVGIFSRRNLLRRLSEVGGR